MTRQLGLQLKAEGMDWVARRGDLMLEWLRHAARAFARMEGSVTIDDVRGMADTRGIIPHHQNLFGAVFRGHEWVCGGFKPSTRPSNHGRLIRVWRLK